MKFSKTRDVKSPLRANPTDAGIDFFVPKITDEYIIDAESLNTDLHFSREGVLLQPQKRILIPTGIKCEVPKGHAMMVKNKSGVASKKGLDKLAQVIDESYQGELIINLVNTSSDNVIIKGGDKIAQMVIIPVNYAIPVEVPIDTLYSEDSNRGEGGFGSTGDK